MNDLILFGLSSAGAALLGAVTVKAYDLTRRRRTPAPAADPAGAWTRRTIGIDDLAGLVEVVAGLRESLGAIDERLGEVSDAVVLDVWREPIAAIRGEVQTTADLVADLGDDLGKWAAGVVPTNADWTTVGIALGGMRLQTGPNGDGMILFPDEDLATNTAAGLRDAIEVAQNVGRPIVIVSSVTFGIANAPGT